MVLGCFHVYSTTDLGLGDWDILTVLFESFPKGTTALGMTDRCYTKRTNRHARRMISSYKPFNFMAFWSFSNDYPPKMIPGNIRDVVCVLPVLPCMVSSDIGTSNDQSASG